MDPSSMCNFASGLCRNFCMAFWSSAGAADISELGSCVSGASEPSTLLALSICSRSWTCPSQEECPHINALNESEAKSFCHERRRCSPPACGLLAARPPCHLPPGCMYGCTAGRLGHMLHPTSDNDPSILQPRLFSSPPPLRCSPQDPSRSKPLSVEPWLRHSSRPPAAGCAAGGAAPSAGHRRLHIWLLVLL